MKEQDILGHPYTAESLDLGADSEGPLVATLVHRPADSGPTPSAGAVLYVHGFVDYFFQRELGDWWAARGYDFYALDLRKYGRSLRTGQTPFYTEDITDYFAELDTAWELITSRDGHQQVVLMGHSTGGLITSLWAGQTAPPELTALILNSPWLDHFEGPVAQAGLTALAATAARLNPRTVLKKPAPDPYARSLHHSTGGIWDFKTAWKTLDFPPIYAGWLTAIRRAQAKLHRGTGITAPVLVLTSARSGRLCAPGQKHDFDAVLSVQQIRRWALELGSDVTSKVIDGATHDVFLSAQPARSQAYELMGRFMRRLAVD